jgi:hypothetical protein
MFRLKYPDLFLPSLTHVTEVPETYHRGGSPNHTALPPRSCSGLTAVMKAGWPPEYFYENSTSW